MKKQNSIIKYLYIILIIALTGCSSEDGAVGPQGPQGVPGEDGSQGIQGEQGLQGPGGTDGMDGNANVIYSDWFFPDWNEFDAPRAKRMIVTDPEFGQNYDDGVILFYWITNNGSTFLVPWNSYSTITGALNISRSMNVRGISGDVWITIRRYDQDFEVRDTFGQFEGIIYNRLRYVIIPGNINVSGKSTLDYNDYEAVKAFYNLPD
ncbi:collagen-like protein [Flagellimonas eckloniae]|uniref:Collagen-like protein n=1 Tax=Flagellimonas eckloniae TaxID=346185 RepID=A0A0Q0WX99_9FLAO|nr:collagen-like protein [Allomuricauda eckloniae]KQC30097.1 hypothetical protein AAY42_09565 [Allomuricauda eckloniae]